MRFCPLHEALALRWHPGEEGVSTVGAVASSPAGHFPEVGVASAEAQERRSVAHAGTGQPGGRAGVGEDASAGVRA